MYIKAVYKFLLSEEVGIYQVNSERGLNEIHSFFCEEENARAAINVEWGVILKSEEEIFREYGVESINFIP